MAIRWTIHAAAQEFNVHRETLGKLLISKSIAPGKDGHYSTDDITSSIFGDLEAEKTRLTKEQADITTLKRKQMEQDLVPLALVESVWSRTIIEYRQRVLASDLPQTLKEELLEILSETKTDEYFAAAIKDLESGPDADAEAA